MRLLGVSEMRGRRRNGCPEAAWVLCALLSLFLAPDLRANGTPAGTQIRAWAEVSFEDANSVPYTLASDTVVVVVGQIAGVDIEPPRNSITDPGTTVVFNHTLANVGNGSDSFLVSGASQSGWPLRIYIDANRDGGLDAGDPQVTGPITLTADDTTYLLVAVDVPGSSALRGTTETVDILTASTFDGSTTDALQDTIEIRDVGIAIALTKGVDRTSATLGETLTYPIDYTATGPNSATNFRIADRIPIGTSYLPGTLRLNGAPLTDGTGDDQAYYDASNNRVVFEIGDITGGASGTVSFQVQVQNLQGTVSNSAAGSFETFAGVDSIFSNSVQTVLAAAEFTLEKTLVGPSVARIGDEIRYTLRYRNSSSSVAVRGIVVNDTLPTGLEYVTSQPPASVNDSVLTWTLGDLAPGDSAQVDLTVRVSDSVRDTLQVSNLAVLTAINAAQAEVARSEFVQLIGVFPDQLALDKTADLLEVAIGEVAPYTLTVENTGSVPLADIRVNDRLPEGGRYANGTLLGADSIQVSERDLTIFFAGPLAPGATRTIHYAVAIVSAETETLANTAFATAEGQLVESEPVTAWIRVRKTWPMETRAAIGKVWVDADGDGVQEPGESGVEGVDIWTEDGAVASTDSEGKFSYRNIRPGRHAYRIDPATIPMAYRLVETGTASDLVIRDSDGWTTPRINFRLVPRNATLQQVRVPVGWTLQAQPLRGPNLREICGEAMADEARTLYFETNSARPPIDTAFIRRVSEALERGPQCWLEVAGHADERPIHGGPYEDNWHLSEARAESVAVRLLKLGLKSSKVVVRGYGDSRPLMVGNDSLALQRNRRVELRLVAPPYWSAQESPVVEYEAVVSNSYDVPLSGLSLRFAPAADSAVVVLDSSLAKLPLNPVTLPTIPPHSQLTVRGWTHAGPDSVRAALESLDVNANSELLAVVHNPLMPVSGVSEAVVSMDSLPQPASVPAGGAVTLVLRPAPAGWPQVTYPLPDGWSYVAGSSNLNGHVVANPEVRRDRTGKPWLTWKLAGGPSGPISLQLSPIAAEPEVPQTVKVAALRSDAERVEDSRRAFVAGPAIEIFEPYDGAVLPSDKVYIGVQGEAGAPVALFDGDSLIAEATLRPDGVHDFIAVALSRGPHRLRVRMQNSWQQERWDSMAVHVTGRPAQITSEEDRVSLVADGHTTATVRARVLDRWGVPVINSVYATVTAEGAEPVGEDVDASSVGLQLATDPAGWLTIDLRPGREVGTGALVIRAGDVERSIALEILPAIRPLMVNGYGRVGVGAAPDAFGSVTARGRLDDRTSVTLSYDSRRLDAGRDVFGRDYDPLEEAQYPILGDASRERAVSASDDMFSARLERGLDWLALGDITTEEFTSGLTLNRYQRALPGVATRITTGPVVWKGFGSSTTQRIRQLQIRGAGVSGPYELEPNIRPGTDYIVLETRAKENAERVISQQSLVRYVDYQIDYQDGTLLFKRPVPAADVYENPVFIVVTYEAESGGDSKAVWGVRAAADASSILESRAVDSLRIGATYINDSQSASELQLAGADVRLLSYGALELGAELSYAQARDSSGLATAIDGSVRLLDGDLDLSAGWMKVGDEYHNPSNLNLRGGTEEIRAAGGLKVGSSELHLEHAQQTFESEGVKRQRTTGGVLQSLGSELELEARLAADRFVTSGTRDESQAGELKLTWTPTQKVTAWTEARHQFNYSGNVVLPDYFGAGAAYKVTEGLSLETQHRRVVPRGDSASYSITNLGIRSALGLGTEAWGSYQIAGGVDGAHNAAVVGLNNRLRVADVSFNTLFERRFGVNNASVADPVRALPFLQAEEDYWSFGLGAEWLPEQAPYRASARGEYRDGDFRASRMFSLAGDISLNRSLAILSRNEYLWTEQPLATGKVVSERKSTLWGLASRPIGSDALNVLTKFEWLAEKDPIGGGVLGAQGDEERLIGALEAIWAPLSWTELAGRYAIRRTEAQHQPEDGLVQNLISWADYFGTRLDLGLRRWLLFRGETRLLVEHTSNTDRFDAAPSLVFIPTDGFEAQFGYRFGDLRDPDFAVNGGPGLFAIFGIRITEQINPTTADFWRPRFGQK